MSRYAATFARVEVHLELHVLRDANERPALIHEQLLRLVECVDIGVVAVAVIREFLEHLVLVVPHAKPEDGEEHLRAPLILDHA